VVRLGPVATDRQVEEGLNRGRRRHQQNGQRCGSAKGIHGTQNPQNIGTVVRSTFQT
jgi:hypothetical protein